MVVITCPACGKSVQLPDDMLGQPAVCPYCKSLFTAPARQDDGTLATPVLRRTNPFTGNRTVAPGLLLILIGGLSLLWTGVQTGRALLDPVAFEAGIREDFNYGAGVIKKRGMEGKAEDDQEARDAAEANATALASKADVTVRWLPVARAVFMGLAAMTILGGVSMLRRRNHPLAMLGSVAAMFNVLNFCCVAGMPVGAYSLFLLMNPVVRDQFTVKKTSPLT